MMEFLSFYSSLFFVTKPQDTKICKRVQKVKARSLKRALGRSVDEYKDLSILGCLGAKFYFDLIVHKLM